MGLTSLPSRSVGSLGPTKIDPKSRTPNVRSVHADEWNEAMDRVVELADTVGLEDGTTEGSLVETLRLADAPTITRRWSFFDDFEVDGTLSTGNWTVTQTNGGYQSPGAIGTSESDGFGWIEIYCLNSGGANASLDGNNAVVRADRDPTFRARIKLPSSLAATQVFFGLRDSTSDAHYARAFTSLAGAWWLACDSPSGTPSLANSGVSATAGGVYEVRIALTGGTSATLAVRADGSAEWLVIATVSTAASIPSGANALRPFFKIERASGGGELRVDWCHVEGDV